MGCIIVDNVANISNWILFAAQKYGHGTKLAVTNGSFVGRATTVGSTCLKTNHLSFR
jgi:hypothetical protein